VPFKKNQKCCCEKHGKIHCNRENYGRPGYAKVWNDQRRAEYHRRRALKGASESPNEPKLPSNVVVLRAEIARRHGWKCGICVLPIDPNLAWPHPLSASLDHVVPLSRGGVHAWGNLQIAHVACNVRKRDHDELAQVAARA
jgi:5-methylcytosine-specific restriction endonuclease McrA